MNVNSIKTEQNYELVMKRIDELILKDKNRTDHEKDKLDILSDLAWVYEESHYPDLPSNPAEAIKFRMDQMGLNRKYLIQFIGTENEVSDILSEKKALTLDMIKALRKGLDIPFESLITEV